MDVGDLFSSRKKTLIGSVRSVNILKTDDYVNFIDADAYFKKNS